MVFLVAALFRRHSPHAQAWFADQHAKYLIDSLGVRTTTLEDLHNSTITF